MNRKTTLFTLSKSLKVFCALCVIASAGAQEQIYTNGGLSTGAISNSGVAAPTGYTWSEAQSDAGNTTESNTNAGFSAAFNTAQTNSFQLADDFTVPDGEQWTISGFEFFGYQTGYTGTTIPIDNLRVQIWDGDPSVAGSTPISGNMTTNVLDATNSGDASMYRIFNSATPAPGTVPGTTRKIWTFRGTIEAVLQPGTYWVVYQAHPTNDGSLFFPAVTLPGDRGIDGWNAKQNVVASTTAGAVLGWNAIVDAGNPAAAPDVAQDMPFNIIGNVTLGVNDNALSKVSIYPNPVKNNVNITLPGEVSIESIQIYDLTGKVVKRAGSGTTSVNVSDLASGSYIIKAVTADGAVTRKFVKE